MNKPTDRPTVIKGRIWIIKDDAGKLIDDIDTDQIYHNAYLAVTEIKEMGKYAFSNLKGWQEFPQKASKGDILIVGKNFGAGSSRQHAVDCFRSLGLSLIIGQSFGAIYKRNAINAGLPLLTCPEIAAVDIRSGDIVEANLQTGEIKILHPKPQVIKAEPLPAVMLDIYKAGGLFSYARTLAQ